MSDNETGLYIFNAIRNIGDNSAVIDVRAIYEAKGFYDGQKVIQHELKKFFNIKPDVIIALKGLELSNKTIDFIRTNFPDTVLVNWFFDLLIDDKLVYESPVAPQIINSYDYFLCSLEGIARVLRRKGFKNVYHVAEACSPEHHSFVYANQYQNKKYSEDIAFCGSIGYSWIHKDRIRILNKIIEEGYRIKIWGKLVSKPGQIPQGIIDAMTKAEAINEQHAMVSHLSKINLGIDASPNIYGSWSARLYRVLCAGGLYLSVNTYGLSDYFKVNPEGEQLTGKEELVVFYNLNDLIEKIDFLLEHDNIRKQIAENGKKKVLNNHTFEHRIKEIKKIISKTKRG